MGIWFRVRPRITWGLISISSLLILTSCTNDKVSQCNLLIATINQTESDLQNITQSSTPDIDALEQIAIATQQAETSLNVLELSNADLKGLRSRFQEFYGNISNDAQAIVAAHAEQDMETAESAYQRLETTFAQQETLVNGVNQYCSEGSPE